jgi:hypothetical protein
MFLLAELLVLLVTVKLYRQLFPSIITFLEFLPPQHQICKDSFARLSLEYPLLEGITYHEPTDEHGFCLSKSVDTGDRLFLYHRVPLWLDQNAVVCDSQVQPAIVCQRHPEKGVITYPWPPHVMETRIALMDSSTPNCLNDSVLFAYLIDP